MVSGDYPGRCQSVTTLSESSIVSSQETESECINYKFILPSVITHYYDNKFLGKLDKRLITMAQVFKTIFEL